jgi:hypothetical protein
MELHWNPPNISELPLKAFYYSADYAAEVHDGDFEKPARPWLMTAAFETEFEKLFDEAIAGKPLTDTNLIAAWNEVAEKFEQILDESMSDERWYWPHRTLRQSGEIAGSPRDIVDTGELRDSLEVFDV